MPDDLPTRADIYAANDGPLSDDDRRQLDWIDRRAAARATLWSSIHEHCGNAIGYASGLRWAGATAHGRGVAHHTDMLRSELAKATAALATYERGL